MTAACPACDRPGDGLLCDRVIVNGRDVSCTANLEHDLGDVPALLADLDITTSRQARIGNPGRGGLASHRWAYNPGSSDVADDLTNTLTTWIRDLTGDQWRPGTGAHPGHAAAAHLLLELTAIRRHPAAAEIADTVADSVRRARHAVDRPADRQFVGPCYAVHPDDEGRDITCTEDLYARPGATEVRCKVCGTEHPVAERRAWLLDQAKDRLFTVREAAQMMGDVGGIRVTEASIRGYLHRGRLSYHGGTTIRLGDLLAVVLDDSEKRSA